LIAWAWPVAGIAAVLMGYWYYRTFRAVALVRKGARDFLLDGSKKNGDLVIKLSTLVLFFVFGYSGIVSQSLYEVTIGRAKIWGDVMAAAIVLVYWVCAPFAYAGVNHRLGIRSVLFADPLSRGNREVQEQTTPMSVSSPHPTQTHSAAEMELSNRDPTGHNVLTMMGVPTPSYNRGTHRLEGSPEDSNGGFFSFDDPRRSEIINMNNMNSTCTTIIEDPSSTRAPFVADNSGGSYSPAGSSVITSTSSHHGSGSGGLGGSSGVPHSDSPMQLLLHGSSGSNGGSSSGSSYNNSGNVSMDSSQYSHVSPHSPNSVSSFGENYRNFIEVTHQFPTTAVQTPEGESSRQIFNPFLAPQDLPALESP